MKQHLGAPQPCDRDLSTYQGAGRSPWQLLIRSLRREQPAPLFQPHPCSPRSWIPALALSSPFRQVGLAVGTWGWMWLRPQQHGKGLMCVYRAPCMADGCRQV